MRPYILAAARMEPTPYTPLWIMRQAGRYLREYRELRERHSFLDLCKNPALAAEATLLPLRKFPLDGAIIFSDLLLPLEAMGLEIAYSEGGPRVLNPIGSVEDVRRLTTEVREGLEPVLEAIGLVKGELRAGVALIGFAGGPFTLACYAIEGGGSTSFLRAKAMMREAPEAFDLLMEKLSLVVRDFLRWQLEAGCHLVQVFDSWAGVLSPSEYALRVLPHTKRATEGLPGPVIHFSTGTGGYVELVARAGDVLGCDWRVMIGEAWRRIGYGKAIQGNLDPSVLLAPKEVIKREVEAILGQTRGRPGHIFNLGHGILPQTPEENVAFLVDLVHTLSEARG